MKPAFNVRQQSEIFIGPLADILSGVLPEGRVVVVSDSTIDRLYHSVLAQYDTVLIGLGESVKTMQTVEMIYRRFIELGVDRSTFVLAVGGGIVTAIPLLMFAAGARRLKLATMGLIQYIGPTMQLMLGVLLYHEPFDVARLVGFALIWSALLLYSGAGVMQVLGRRRAAGAA